MAILIVDDSPTNLAVLKSLASSVYDGEARAFASARAALDYLQREPVDLIVVDYAMPDLNGIAFIREVRETSGHAATPIVMVTHSADQRVRAEALEAGATDFVNKPVNAVEFKSRIKGLLAMKQSRSSAA